MEVSSRRAAPAADFPRDVSLTISRNHKVFLLSTANIYVKTTIVTLWNNKSNDLSKKCLAYAHDMNSRCQGVDRSPAQVRAYSVKQ